MMYDEDYIDSLPALLSNSNSLEEVLFYDNADDVLDEDPPVWRTPPCRILS